MTGHGRLHSAQRQLLQVPGSCAGGPGAWRAYLSQELLQRGGINMDAMQSSRGGAPCSSFGGLLSRA